MSITARLKVFIVNLKKMFTSEFLVERRKGGIAYSDNTSKCDKLEQTIRDIAYALGANMEHLERDFKRSIRGVEDGLKEDIEIRIQNILRRERRLEETVVNLTNSNTLLVRQLEKLHTELEVMKGKKNE